MEKNIFPLFFSFRNVSDGAKVVEVVVVVVVVVEVVVVVVGEALLVVDSETEVGQVSSSKVTWRDRVGNFDGNAWAEQFFPDFYDNI